MKEPEMQYLVATSKTTEWSWFVSKGKSFNITVIQVYTSTTNAEEAEVEWFHKCHKIFQNKYQKKMCFSLQGIRMQK